MKVKIFLEKGAVMPRKAHESDACYDLTVLSLKIENGVYKYDSGVHYGLPERDKNGNRPFFKAFARSGIHKTGLILSNGVGVLDNGYRGSIKGVFYPIIETPTPYEIPTRENDFKGDRFLQICLASGEDIEWEQVSTIEELGETDRGSTGYGDSGLK